MTARQTVHATALVVGERGLLLRGPSGSGKSSLALALIEAERSAGRFAMLVADDRLFLDAANGRLIARVPSTIAGLAERYGQGLEPHPHIAAAVIHLVGDFVEPAQYARMPETEALTCRLEGVEIRRQPLPARRIEEAMRLVQAALRRA
ncbi:HPr kinase/phosphorylase [Oryzibacter oryziterrae]|uniref:HPr kinase/phosphorylase n=1 Tax=Oryzibacter oryziterrae TaxID=2766474 RepID=UPI001F2511B1|nr:HPr kinase/phosphatase C-terminal domain-containing protein [Oryzibacter oryziterrae]